LNRIDRVPFWLVCGIAVVGCLALAFVAVAAIADAPYRAERYAGRIDPVRAGMFGFFLAAITVFVLFVVADIVAWRRTADSARLATALLMGGLAISSVALAILIVSMPPVSRLTIPEPLRIMLFAGVGVSLAGFIPAAASGFVAAVRRRDVGFLVAVWVVLLLLLVRAIAGP
jgi:hypothetical protein